MFLISDNDHGMIVLVMLGNNLSICVLNSSGVKPLDAFKRMFPCFVCSSLCDVMLSRQLLLKGGKMLLENSGLPCKDVWK